MITNKFFVLLVLILLCGLTAASAQDTIRPSTTRWSLELCPEYYLPVYKDREIQTVFLMVLAGKEVDSVLHYSLSAGIIGTYSQGNIMYSFSAYQKTFYNTSALGIGPVFLLRGQLLRFEKSRLYFDFACGILFYNKYFPPGGDIYNLFTQTGISYSFELSKTFEANFGARYLHISNGQGSGLHNPVYEGIGINVAIIKYY